MIAIKKGKIEEAKEGKVIETPEKLAVKKPQVTIRGEAEALISQAIDKNVSVETMEKLLAMRRELKAEKAKEEYDRSMANFQTECPIIEKTKEVRTKTGAIAYKYAPIESIVAQVKEALKNNGFSYSTNMELKPTGVKVFVKVTHNGGHSEITEMEVPLGTQTNIMSSSQVVAAAQTFAKRYAFCNAFGILTGNEDTDAAPTEENKQLPENQQTSKPENKPDGLISYKQILFIKELLGKKGYTEVELCHKYEVVKIDDLTKEQASTAINGLMQVKPKTAKEPEPTEAELVIDNDAVEKGIEESKKQA